MKTRLILSLIIVPIFAFILFNTNPWPLIGVMIVALTWALTEVYSMLRAKELKPYDWAGVIFGLYIYAMTLLKMDAAILYGWAVFMILIFTLAVLSRNEMNFTRIGATYLPLIYISSLGIFGLKLRMMDHGYYMTFLLFLYTLVYDGGAYFAGSFFGKNKLIPEISKGKTIEGCVGGVIVSMITVIIVGLTWLPKDLFGPNTMIHLIILSVLLSVVGQLGDLSASLLKRFCGVKNSSNLLPEMGGVLDKIDSAMFNAPVLFLYAVFVTKLF